MSFLLCGRDDGALTLEAALAFIDTCADTNSARLPTPGSPTLNSSEAGVRHKAPKSSRSVAPSTLQQRRRKQEILSLRQETIELEQLLAQLRSQRRAIVERSQLERAEEENRRLKAIWHNLTALNGSIQDFLIVEHSATGVRFCLLSLSWTYDGLV